MSGFKTWDIGEVVEAGDFQSYIMNQTVMKFADDASRTSQLGTAVTEGMISYLVSTEAIEYFDGAVWEPVANPGDITAVTAGTALTGGGTVGDVTLDVDLSAITIPTSQISDITASAAELNILDGVTATAAELNILDGATVTAAALNTIDDGTEGFTALSNGTAGISYQPVSHNYIINGAFDFWQRGTSFGPTTAAIYTSDRWQINPSGATTELSQQTLSPADITAIGYGEGQFHARLETTAADDNTALMQKVEDVRTLAGQTATLSAYIKTSASNTLRFRVEQNFGSGGSSLEGVSGADFVTTTSWQRFYTTISIPSISGKTLGAGSFLNFLILNPNNETFTMDIWGVQIEAGSVATPFKRNAPSLQGELAACQRYYQLIAEFDTNRKLIGTGNYITSTQMRVDVNLITEMRANPSIEIASVTDAYRFVAPSADDFTTATISLVGRSRVQLINTTQVSGTAGNAGSVFVQLSGGKLAFSAEL